MSARPLRADAARNYERIVVAAVETFDEIGPEATLEQIAERAEVSVMTLYRRFSNRDQLIQAVFDHLLVTEIEPVTTTRTDDPWQDLVDALATVTDLLVQRQAIHSLAREFQAFANETAQHFLRSMQGLLNRAIDANEVRPELEVRDLVAVIVMTIATAHPGDPDGADRRRYLALLADGLRPSPTTLPPPSSHDMSGPPDCGQ
ncbi:TetR/AcrR family transcriptional regulator [Streptomyces sp. NPDC057257]|uniref:TetR/AcrR family transcriptional regulator n=1 Tax=Streptomyces sp. NPDC057257 TaxID=3346071 RepID=UPI003631C824